MPDPFAPTHDPLGEALHVLRVSGVFCCRSDLSAPWALTMPAEPGWVWFHAVVRGQCTLVSDRFDPIPLAAGSLALVPHGLGHQVESEPGVPAPVVTDVPHELATERYAVLRYGGGGAPSTLVCGVVRLEHPSAVDLVRSLPEVIAFDALEADPGGMQHTIRLIAAESRALEPGGETVVTALADVLVVQAIRRWLRDAPAARTGWLGAVRDPQVGRALAAVHRDPARPWTVASLAAAAGMSRSAFAARFTALVGETPIRYVTRARMQVAAERLRDADTLHALAAEVGYRSEAAFGRAFKRTTGQSPGRARRRGSVSGGSPP